MDPQFVVDKFGEDWLIMAVMTRLVNDESISRDYRGIALFPDNRSTTGFVHLVGDWESRGDGILEPELVLYGRYSGKEYPITVELDGNEPKDLHDHNTTILSDYDQHQFRKNLESVLGDIIENVMDR